MNANELAEIQAFKTEELTMWERNHTATMLRQQQAEIQALKEKLMMEEESYMLLDEESLCAKESIKQQQAEIEALKALNKSIIDDPLQFMKIKAQEK
jgi:hypothetical protein